MESEGGGGTGGGGGGGGGDKDNEEEENEACSPSLVRNTHTYITDQGGREHAVASVRRALEGEDVGG